MTNKLDHERWKWIPGYEGAYQASNLGRVRSVDRRVSKGSCTVFKPGVVLRPAFHGKGYLQVSLSKDGKSSSIAVHRCVATAFLPNPNGLPEVNHINEIKTDNCVENLEWCTHRYNSLYGTKNYRTGQTLRRKKINCKPVVQFSLNGEMVAEYDSIEEAAKAVGCKCPAAISQNLLGVTRSSCGYKWRYKSSPT